MLCSLRPMFCARITNHKRSLMINSVYSFIVHGSTRQLVPACDFATAEASISNTADRKRTVMNIYGCFYLFYTHGDFEQTHTLTTYMYSTLELVSMLLSSYILTITTQTLEVMSVL